MRGQLELDGKDPDVPILRDLLGMFQEAVAAGGLTPDSANAALGQVADGLVHNRKPELEKYDRWKATQPRNLT